MATARIVGSDIKEIRREICARIDQLERDFRLLSIGELGRRADAIRQLAHDNGMASVGGLAAGLGEALSRGGRGAMIRPFVDGMRDAVAGDHQDEASASLYLASVNVRLAG